MTQRYSVVHLVLVALLASVATGVIDHLTRAPTVAAKAPEGPPPGFSVEVLPGEIVLISQSGDIWGYDGRNGRPRYHWKIVEMGKPLQEAE